MTPYPQTVVHDLVGVFQAARYAEIPALHVGLFRKVSREYQSRVYAFLLEVFLEVFPLTRFFDGDGEAERGRVFRKGGKQEKVLESLQSSLKVSTMSSSRLHEIV
jgi:hypothetical protein